MDTKGPLDDLGEFDPGRAEQLVELLGRTEHHLSAFIAAVNPLRDRQIAILARRQLRRLRHYVIEKHWKVICAEANALVLLLKMVQAFAGDALAFAELVTVCGCILLV